MIMSSHSRPQTVCHGYQSFISSFLRLGLEGLHRLPKACQWKSFPKNEFVKIGKLLRLTRFLSVVAATYKAKPGFGTCGIRVIWTR